MRRRKEADGGKRPLTSVSVNKISEGCLGGGQSDGACAAVVVSPSSNEEKLDIVA